MMREYVTPELSEIGSLHDLTLQDKQFGEDDGFTFQGQPIGNAS